MTEILQKDHNYNNLKIYESCHIRNNSNTINFKTDTYNMNKICNNLIHQSKKDNSNTQNDLPRKYTTPTHNSGQKRNISIT